MSEDHRDPLAGSRVLMRAVRVLHGRGAERVAIFPYLSPTGLHWRCRVLIRGTKPDSLAYTSASGWTLPGSPSGEPIDAATCADQLWELLDDDLRAAANRPDADYVEWYAGLLQALGDGLPILYDDSPGPAPYELGHLRIVGPGHRAGAGESTYPLPPGDSLAQLLGHD